MMNDVKKSPLRQTKDSHPKFAKYVAGTNDFRNKNASSESLSLERSESESEKEITDANRNKTKTTAVCGGEDDNALSIYHSPKYKIIRQSKVLFNQIKKSNKNSLNKNVNEELVEEGNGNFKEYSSKQCDDYIQVESGGARQNDEIYNNNYNNFLCENPKDLVEGDIKQNLNFEARNGVLLSVENCDLKKRNTTEDVYFRKNRNSLYQDVEEALKSLLWQPYEYQNSQGSTSLSSLSSWCSSSSGDLEATHSGNTAADLHLGAVMVNNLTCENLRGQSQQTKQSREPAFLCGTSKQQTDLSVGERCAVSASRFYRADYCDEFLCRFGDMRVEIPLSPTQNVLTISTSNGQVTRTDAYNGVSVARTEDLSNCSQTSARINDGTNNVEQFVPNARPQQNSDVNRTYAYYNTPGYVAYSDDTNAANPSDNQVNIANNESRIQYNNQTNFARPYNNQTNSVDCRQYASESNCAIAQCPPRNVGRMQYANVPRMSNYLTSNNNETNVGRSMYNNEHGVSTSVGFQGLSSCLQPTPVDRAGQSVALASNLRAANVVGLPNHPRQCSVPSSTRFLPANTNRNDQQQPQHFRWGSTPATENNNAIPPRSNGLPPVNHMRSASAPKSFTPQTEPAPRYNPPPQFNARPFNAAPSVKLATNVNVNYYRAVPVNIVSNFPGNNVSNVNIVPISQSSPQVVTSGGIFLNANTGNTASTALSSPPPQSTHVTHCTEVIVHNSETQSQTPPTRTFTSTEAQTDDTAASVINREQRRRERRERRHHRRTNTQHRHSSVDSGTQWNGGQSERLPDILNSHLPPPYSSVPQVGPAPPPPPPPGMVPAGAVLQTMVPNNIVPNSVVGTPMVPYPAPVVPGRVPLVQGGAPVAVPVPVPPPSGFRFTFAPNGFRR